MTAAREPRAGKYLGLLPGATSDGARNRISARVSKRGWQLLRTIEEAFELHPAIADGALEHADTMATDLVKVLEERILRDRDARALTGNARRAANGTSGSHKLFVVDRAIALLLLTIEEAKGEPIPRQEANRVAPLLRRLADLLATKAEPLPPNVRSIDAYRRGERAST